MKNKLYQIEKFKQGDKINGFYLCKSAKNKISRLGDEYIDLILEDSTGNIRAKIWSYVDQYKSVIDQIVPVAVKGKIISFNNALEIDISFISPIENDLYDRYGFNKDLLFKYDSKHMEKQLNVFLKYVDLLSKTNKKILSKIVSDYKVQILQIPSLDKEYNFKGGFLKQLCSSLNLYSKIHSIYSFKYEDIIIGIMLKNIGLVKYFNNDIVFSISERNKSIGTQVLGIKIIDKYYLACYS